MQVRRPSQGSLKIALPDEWPNVVLSRCLVVKGYQPWKETKGEKFGQPSSGCGVNLHRQSFVWPCSQPCWFCTARLQKNST
jgi:hypothetical protein